MPKKGQNVVKKECGNCAYKDGDYELYRYGVKVGETAGMCTQYTMNRKIIFEHGAPCEHYSPKFVSLLAREKSNSYSSG